MKTFKKISNKMNFHTYSAKDIDGNLIEFKSYKDKVCLVVNIASCWGRTNRDFQQLVSLDKKYKEKGLEILAFPCNLNGKEPKSNSEIKEFLQKFQVEFTTFSKIEINTKDEHELYTFLKKEIPLGDIEFNFTKFLVDRKGKVVYRDSEKTAPFEIEEKILNLL